MLTVCILVLDDTSASKTANNIKQQNVQMHTVRSLLMCSMQARPLDVIICFKNCARATKKGGPQPLMQSCSEEVYLMLNSSFSPCTNFHLKFFLMCHLWCHHWCRQHVGCFSWALFAKHTSQSNILNKHSDIIKKNSRHLQKKIFHRCSHVSCWPSSSGR